MDITNFMTWFLDQVISIFKFVFNTMDSITFMGTSLLKVVLTIVIISALIPILLTIGKSSRITAERADKVRDKGENND